MGLDLRAILTLDGSGFAAGIRRAQTAAAGLSGTLNGSLKGAIAGAFSVGAIAAISKKTIEYASHLNDLADRLGVSTDFLQEFQYAAKQTGADVDDLTTFIEKLNTARMKALGGKGGEADRANFARFGIGEQDLKSTGAEGLIMNKIAVAFEHGNTEQLSAAMRALGGKAAGALIPAFQAGLKDMANKAHQAGAVMGEDVLQQLDDIGDRFDILGVQLMTTLGPAILKVVEWIKKVANVVEQVVNAVVAGAQNMGVKDIARTGLKAMMGPLGKLLGGDQLLDKIFGTAHSFDWGLAGQAALDVEEEQKKKAAAEEKARKDLREARRKRAGAPTEGFSAPEIRRGGPEDSLVKVGNFLGSSSNTLAAIGERTNSLLQTISRQMGTLITNTQKNGSIFPENS